MAHAFWSTCYNLMIPIWVASLLVGSHGTVDTDNSHIGQPVALVFETDQYVAGLSNAGWDLVQCDANWSLNKLKGPIEAIAAVVGQPNNVSLLKELPRLQLLHSTSYMYTKLADVPQQVTVASYQPDWSHVWGVEPIAEFVLAAVFDWNYRIHDRKSRFAACAWGPEAPRYCPSTKDLTSHPVLMGQTLGVLGYGNIGQAVARRSASLGMRTVATKRHSPFWPLPPGLTWLSNNNDRLLRESDFVVVTVPGSLSGLINRTSLQLMKPGAVIIPVSAPPLDFDALYEALVGKTIGGAVIDVWPHGCWHYPDMDCGPPYGAPAEPYSLKPIHNLDNVIVLPGMAMRDERFWAGSVSWVSTNLHALIRGSALRGVIRNGTDTTGRNDLRQFI